LVVGTHSRWDYRIITVVTIILWIMRFFKSFMAQPRLAMITLFVVAHLFTSARRQQHVDYGLICILVHSVDPQKI